MKVIQISAIWCSSCLAMKKIWKEVKQEFPQLEWICYDLDFDPEVKQYQVGDSIPVLVFLKDEVEQSRLVGEKTKEEIITWLKELLSK